MRSVVPRVRGEAPRPWALSFNAFGVNRRLRAHDALCELCLGGGLGLAVIDSSAGGLASSVDPEQVERIGVGELVGSQL